VTAGQYCDFLSAVAADDTYELYNGRMADPNSPDFGCNIDRSGSSGSYTYTVAAGYENRPVNYVNWGDAARFCNWLHNGQPTGGQDVTTTEDGSYLLDGATYWEDLQAVVRKPGATWVIPTEDEWYKAAYHANDGVTGNYWEYPTSTNGAPSNELMDPDPGNNANFHDAGFTIGGPLWRTEVGDFENSIGPYGTFDQGGNVHEWNEAMPSGSARGKRGGAWNSELVYLAASYRAQDGVTQETSYNGFRVAEVFGQVCTALDARSLKDHSTAGELALSMGTMEEIEPRLGGIEKLEIDLDDASSVSQVIDVTCWPTAWAGSVPLAISGTLGDTITAEFTPALPDESCCTVTLDCGASVCVRSCEGDVNRSGRTTTEDTLRAKIRFGQAVTDANCEWDFDLSGGITTADSLAVASRLGFAAPQCP
jgi:formylglycine-generating enzyme required for sulfatase activity